MQALVIFGLLLFALAKGSAFWLFVTIAVCLVIAKIDQHCG